MGHVSFNGFDGKNLEFLNEFVMEAYILEHPEVLALEGFGDVEVHGFEVPWKITGSKAGRIDILVSYDKEFMAVAELKKGKLELEHLDQLDTYLTSEDPMSNVPDFTSESNTSKADYKWLGVLVGNDVNPNVLKKIEDQKGMIARKVPVAVILLNKYKVDNNIFTVSDVRYLPKKGKDTTQYRFNGSVYGKSRLVLALVKYMESLSKSKVEVDKIGNGIKFNGGRTFLMEFDAAIRCNNTPNTKGNLYRYYFPKDSEAVVLDGVKYAVSYWWTKGEMKDIINNANDLKLPKIVPDK